MKFRLTERMDEGILSRLHATAGIPARIRRTILAFLIMLVPCTAASDENQPQRFALLIGVQKYANLSDGEQLNGAVNDVELVRNLLVDRFAFQNANVVTLLDEQATGAAIREQFELLTRRVQMMPQSGPTAQVVVHFSGHGSQVSDQPPGDPDHDEIDGLDETLVPYDAGRQGGPEDIRDDEIYRLVEDLCQDGKAKLWVILDCCHSGTGARGGTKVRKLHRDVPLAAVAATEEAVSVHQRKLPAGAIVLSACRSLEVEPEFVDGGRHFGLLSRFLVQVLNEQQAVSRLSYSSLREAILARYRQDPSVRQPPEPQLEADTESLKSIVMSSTSAMDRDPWWLVVPANRDGTEVTIQAGAFHGITAGSLFELYARPDQIEWTENTGQPDVASPTSMAWIRVETVDAASARGRVFVWTGEQQTAHRLPPDFSQGYAVERIHQPGEFGLRVKVVRAISAQQDSNALTRNHKLVPNAIRQALSTPATGSEAAWLDWVDDNQAADVVIRFDGDFLAVFPFTSGTLMASTLTRQTTNVPPSLKGGWGPLDLRQTDASTQLFGLLRQVTRARNLLRVAAAQQASSTAEIDVSIELMKIDVDENATITKADPWPRSGDQTLTMPAGSLYTVRVTNNETPGAGKPVFVAVLAVDADMGIDHLIPYQSGSATSEEQRLLPGESRLSGPFQCSGDEGGSPVAGPRTAVVLATREPNDFHRLTQPTLSRTRSVTGNESSLTELLHQQTYFQPTRGDARLRPRKLFDHSWFATTLTWNVVP